MCKETIKYSSEIPQQNKKKKILINTANIVLGIVIA